MAFMPLKRTIVHPVLCTIPFVAYHPASFDSALIFLRDQSSRILCKVLSDMLVMKGSIKKPDIYKRYNGFY